MEALKFSPDIDIKDAVVVVHLEGNPEEMRVKGRFIRMQDGFIHLYGHTVSGPEGAVAVESQKSATGAEGEIRSYVDKSALVRFMHRGRFCTGAVTHATNRAWRVLNLDLGATWVPKSVIRWSPVAGQFCITDEDYYPEFTKDIAEGMGAFPTTFCPDGLIDELYQDDETV